MAEPEGEAKRRDGDPWNKTQAVVLPRRQVEVPPCKTWSVVTLRP